jgi:hypothetical protein
MLALAALGVWPVSTLVAQSETRSKELLGNWIYRLGPNALFALHLEPDPAAPQRIRGYLLHPEHFNLSTTNGVLLRFSGITNQSQRDSIVSLGWDKDALRLGQAPSAEPKDKAKTAGELIFSVHATDAAHLDLNLFVGMSPLPMERTE